MPRLPWKGPPSHVSLVSIINIARECPVWSVGTVPELPEVETTKRGIAPHVIGQTIVGLEVRESRLRFPLPRSLGARLIGMRVQGLRRRGKYLLFDLERGCLLLHLGMSGSLRVVPGATPPLLHDHLDISFQAGHLLRFTDPRRFGFLDWSLDPVAFRWLRGLGPEPLTSDCTGQYLYERAHGRRVAVKHFIMNHQIVAGIGNIYANESLFRAGILPTRMAGRIALRRYERLVCEIRATLSEAIAMGGVTLRNFSGSDGRPGYFRMHLQAYGRGGQPCSCCDRPLTEVCLGGRTTVFCRLCQT